MSAPIKHTCPDIDSLQKKLTEAMRDIEREPIEDQRFVKNIVWELNQVVDGLEDLRKANGALRDWGEDLETQLKESNDRIDELEWQIEEEHEKQKTA